MSRLILKSALLRTLVALRGSLYVALTARADRLS